MLSVAVDAQGPTKPRCYAEKAETSFPTVVDRENLLSETFGFKAVPNCLLIDEEGIFRYRMYGGFDIRKTKFRRLVDTWVSRGVIDDSGPNTDAQLAGLDHSRAMDHFHKGMDLYNRGRVREALLQWRRSVVLEQDNYVIRKQIWAIEHPEKFYKGDVDYDWQRGQIEKGL